MKTVTISSLRSKIRHYLNLVAESSEVIIVPRTNKDDAVVILSLQEYNALTETNYLFSSEANRKRLLESIRQANEGETISYTPDDLK
jgi:antitoxin YefM